MRREFSADILEITTVAHFFQSQQTGTKNAASKCIYRAADEDFLDHFPCSYRDNLPRLFSLRRFWYKEERITHTTTLSPPKQLLTHILGWKISIKSRPSESIHG